MEPSGAFNPAVAGVNIVFPTTSFPVWSINNLMNFNSNLFKPCWETEYLCVNNQNMPQCLVCFQILECKENDVKMHYVSWHKFQFSKYTGNLRLAVIKDLKSKLFSQAPRFLPILNREEVARKASFIICDEIFRRQKPYSDGAFIKECAIKMARVFGCEEMAKCFESVPLSHEDVAQRISVIDQYVGQKVHEAVKKCTYFSIAVDENTDITGTNQLIICIRTVDEDFNISEELLRLIPLKDDTKDEDVYKEIKMSLAEYGGFGRCITIILDGSKSKEMNNSGLSGLLKRDGVDILLLHCIVHEEALVENFLKMSDVMEVIIKITNLIRDQKCAATHRRFQALLEETEAASCGLPQKSNVQWLKKGDYLCKFFQHRKEINRFLSEINCDTYLEECLCDIDFHCSLAFLTDIMKTLNSLNKNLKVKEQTVSQLCNHIFDFMTKLMMLKLDLLQNNLTKFECCNELFHEVSACGALLNFNKFIPKIEALIQNFSERYQGFNEINLSLQMYDNPLFADISEAPICYQMEMSEIKKAFPISYSTAVGLPFFKALDRKRFPNLRDSGLKLASMFGSLYICEKTFSDLNHIFKYRNNSANITLLQSLRLLVTNFNLDVMVSQVSQ